MPDRREFLKAAAGISVGFCLGPVAAAAEAAQPLPPMIRRNPRIDSWLALGTDGGVRVYTGRVELGQGIRTALAQIVAEELDLGLDAVRIETVDTAHSPDEGYTFGSVSIQLGGTALRHAAAYLREILVARAAELLRAQPDRLEVGAGQVRAPGGGSASYAEIAEAASLTTEVGAATPKPVEHYRSVGTSAAREDIPAKVFAEAVFIQDFRPPDVVHARMVKPPAHTSTLEAIDTAALGDDIDVVRDGSFVAVLSGNEYRAVRAAAALAGAARWSAPASYPGSDAADRWLELADADEAVVHDEGRPVGDTARRFSVSYRRGFHAHASLSPSMAIARFADGVLTVWCHGQGMYPLRGAIAGVVGLDDNAVRCIHMQSSGVYGHNGADDAACDAAVIAMARPGTTVRLQYSRGDEFATEPLGSAMRIAIDAGTDADGRIRDWTGTISSGPHSTRPNGRRSAGFLGSAALLETPAGDAIPRPLALPRGGADRNAVPYYAIDRVRLAKRFIADTPTRVSALRALGAYANIFAIDSLVDEMAAAHDRDPFDYRLEHLDDERARTVLARLRELCAQTWDDDQPFGVGFGRYKNSAAYCAVAVRVEVDAGRERIVARRAIAVVDAGLVVNPDGVENQVEGGIVQSTSWTLKERMFVRDRARSGRDWASYPILTFSEVPEVRVELIDRPDRPSLGVGEVSQGPMAAAIGNAIARTTGVRMRELPIRYEDLAAAMTTTNQVTKHAG